jgi:hypothetical protein
MPELGRLRRLLNLPNQPLAGEKRLFGDVLRSAKNRREKRFVFTASQRPDDYGATFIFCRLRQGQKRAWPEGSLALAGLFATLFGWVLLGDRAWHGDCPCEVLKG